MTGVLFDAVTQCKGTVVSFGGGRLLASWNATKPVATHATQACHCALAMHEGVAGLRGRWADTGLKLNARIGIATCRATFGHVGRSHVCYNILGSGIAVVQVRSGSGLSCRCLRQGCPWEPPTAGPQRP